VSDGKLVALPDVFGMTKSQVQKKSDQAFNKKTLSKFFFNKTFKRRTETMKRKTAFDGQNERDQYLTRQPLDVLRVEERNIILLCALKATTVGMLVIIEPQHLNAFNFKKMF